MTAGPVNQASLQANYQNAGQVYDDTKTEGAFGVLSDQIDDNWFYLSGLVPASFVNSNAFTKHNVLINGSMEMFQRASSGLVPALGGFASDRWFVRRDTGVTGAQFSKQNTAQGHFLLRIGRVPGDALPNGYWTSQRVETNNAVAYRNKQVTISFRARKGVDYSEPTNTLRASFAWSSDIDATFSNSFGTLNNQLGSNNQNFTLTTSFQTFTYTSSVMPGTINTIAFLLGTPTSDNLVGIAGANDYIDIDQVQIVEGSQVLPWQYRQFGEELMLCQRYYEKSYNTEVNPGTVTSSGALAFKQTFTSSQPTILSYMANKRATPTVTTYNPITGASGTWRDITANTDLTATASNNGHHGSTVNTSTTTVGNTVIGHFSADAEF